MKAVTNAFLGILAVTAACSNEPSGDEEYSDKQQSVTEGNALLPNRIVTNRIVTNRIVTNRLSNGNYQLNDNAAELVETPEGRELLTYVVSCALGEDQVVESTYRGTTYTFEGDVGLARGWVNHKLDIHDQRWVSSCLLARVNGHGISLLVSLRGPSSHLQLTDEEKNEYTVEEGAFYGNIFTPEDEPLLMYACRGKDQAAGEPNPGSPLADRDCTEEDPAHPGLTQCGFVYVGDCADFAATNDDDDDDDDHGHGHGCGHGHGHHWGHGHGHHDDASAPHACEEQGGNGDYKKCHTEASDDDGDFEGGTRYREIVTVFLRP